MEREKTTVIFTEGRTFRVDKVPALAGSNLLRKFAGMGQDKPLAAFIAGMTDDDYAALQKTCLMVVSEIVADKPMPVMMADGRLAVDLNPDLIYTLTFGSLLFQLESFFGASAFQGFVSMLSASSPAGA